MDGRSLRGLCLLIVGCLPGDELAAYSAGSEPPVSPSTNPPSDPEATPEPSDPGGSMSDNDGSSPASSDTETPEAPAFDPGSDEPVGDAPEGELDEPDEGSAPPVDAEPAPAVPVEDDPAPTPAAMQVRFVRLVADSAVQGGPYTSIAEFNLLDGARSPIDRSAWVARADSEETVYVGGALAGYAIDGETASIWHTAWFQQNPAPSHPHTLEIDMGALHAVSGFRYLARQDGSLDGSVGAFRFYVSVDGSNWGEPVVAGTLASSTNEQEIALP